MNRTRYRYQPLYDAIAVAVGCTIGYFIGISLSICI